MPGSPNRSLSGFPAKTLSPPHTCYMPRPSHSSRCNHPYNIGWGVQIMKHLIMKFSLPSCYLVPLGPNILLTPYFQTPQPTFLPQCQRPSFTLIKNIRQNYGSVYKTVRISEWVSSVDTDMEVFMEVRLERFTGQRSVKFPTLASNRPNVNIHVSTSLNVFNNIKIPGTTAGSSATKRLQFISL
jgi:hypothetical protein